MSELAMTPAAVRMRRLRMELRRLGLCVCGSGHGPMVKGGRCASCWSRKVAPDVAMAAKRDGR